MNVPLTPELEELLADRMKSGMYPTLTDVLLESLWLLKDRDARIDALRADIEEGFAAVERGEYTDYDVSEVGTLADKIKAEGMQRALDRRALKPTDRQMIDFK